jgi:hypothetical protein
MKPKRTPPARRRLPRAWLSLVAVLLLIIFLAGECAALLPVQ